MDPKVLALAALGMGAGFFIQQKLSSGEKEVDTALRQRVAAFEWAESDFNFEATLKHALWISKHVLDGIKPKLKDSDDALNIQWSENLKAYAQKVLDGVWPDKKVFPKVETRADFQQLSRYIAAPAIGALIGYRAKFPPGPSELVTKVEEYNSCKSRKVWGPCLVAAVQVVQTVFKAVDPEQRVENLVFLNNDLVEWGHTIIPLAMKEGSELEKSFEKAYDKYVLDEVGDDDAIVDDGDTKSQGKNNPAAQGGDRKKKKNNKKKK